MSAHKMTADHKCFIFIKRISGASERGNDLFSADEVATKMFIYVFLLFIFPVNQPIK